MNDRTDILLRLFEESMEHVRHLEEQRSQFASVLIAVAGGVVAFGLSDGKPRPDYSPGLLLTGIGLFGLLLSWKQNEKINYHRQVAIRHRKLISVDPTVIAENLEGMRDAEVKINDQRYCRISILPVGLFWSLLYVMILGFGFFMTIQAKKDGDHSASSSFLGVTAPPGKKSGQP